MRVIRPIKSLYIEEVRMTDSPGQFTIPTPPQAAPGGGYPPQVPQQFQPPHQPQPLAQKGNGLAVAALVLGIIALVFCWIPFLNVLSIILGLIGLGLGVPELVGALRGRRSGKGMAITGVILSVVAIIVAIAISAAATVAVDDALSGTDVSTSTDSGSSAGTGGSGDKAASADGVYAYGDTVTFEDGSTLTVEAPVKPGEALRGRRGGVPGAREVQGDVHQQHRRGLRPGAEQRQRQLRRHRRRLGVPERVGRPGQPCVAGQVRHLVDGLRRPGPDRHPVGP